jgi:hypothetical protein
VRRIELQPPGDRKWKRWLADCVKATDKLCEQRAEGGPAEVTALYKRKSIKESYFFSKGPPFYGKCAYCEAPIVDYQHGDVEHFRPKLAVTDENDNPIFLRDDDGNVVLDAEGLPVHHPGYYWLAYDWTNLLPSCVKCDQPSKIGDTKIGKHSRFPVRGRHAQSLEEVADEQPLLIHPGEDDPAEHLSINSTDGLLVPLSERGQTCIDLLGLNLRDQLVEDRKKACDQVWYLVNRLTRPGGDAQAAQELLDIRNGKKSFTMAQLAALNEAGQALAPVLSRQVETPPEGS